MRIEFKATEGPAEGRSFSFDRPDIFIFGRALDAHCSVPSDGTISRRHFMLEVNPPDCVLTDLDSGNGTVVNGVRYGGRGPAAPGLDVQKPRPIGLHNGDRIRAGLSSFIVGITHGLRCDRCGRGLPVQNETVLASVGGMMLCDECGDKAFARAEGDGIVPKVVSSLLCARCGRDATQEVGLRALVADVEYVCAACRSIEREGRAAAKDGMKGAPQPPAIDGYEYVRLIGTGGQGAVYLARQLATGREVAIKTLLPSVAVMEESAARFIREIKTTSSLRHPNVVETIEHGKVGPVFYFVMEYVEGIDAEELVKMRNGRVPEGEAVAVMLQALEGLAYAHGMGFVHRDLKPGNILLAGRAPPWGAKVADFGLAKSFEMAGLSGLTMEGDIKGTVWFMPKEQITHFRWLKPSADVFSMAATLYFMLTGKPVKRGLENATNAPAAVRAVTGEPPVPIRQRRRDIPRALAEVLDKSLSDDEAERYPDAGAMKEALVEALRG